MSDEVGRKTDQQLAPSDLIPALRRCLAILAATNDIDPVRRPVDTRDAALAFGVLFDKYVHLQDRVA